MIVSDVIFALWKNRKEIDINLSLRSYLIKAVRNRCLNYLAQLNKREDVRSHIGNLIGKGTDPLRGTTWLSAVQPDRKRTRRQNK